MDEIATNHHAVAAWDGVVQAIRTEMARRGVHAARVVVLLPYAQLIPVARAAWARAAVPGTPFFVPRFETTMTWAGALQMVAPRGDDLRMDAARDMLTAASLLERAGLGARRAPLAGPLMEAAWSLARRAAAVVPSQRIAWGAQQASALEALAAAPALELETLVGRVALAWVAHSAYATDRVFEAQADLLVLVQGLQQEPLHQALQQLWAERAMALQLDPTVAMDFSAFRLPDHPVLDGAGPLARPGPVRGAICLYQAQDAEDEAERAAARVLEHLAAGRSPVALVAQDRLLTRRVRALLGEHASVVRDETGWTLSTTRAAATVMGLLRALAWDASTDAVLDWAKNAPGFASAAVGRMEATLRRAGTRDWRRVDTTEGLAQQLQSLRDSLQAARPLSAWLGSLRQAVQAAGQWQALREDPAGQAVLDALRLRDMAETEFADQTQRIPQSAFVAWVSQVLEAGSFLPPHPQQARVLILPMSQLLGRPVAAVVMAGCDEVRLPTAPEPPGPWTPVQRVLLDLPSRDQLAATARATWHYALRSPAIDLLWRSSDGGERLMPSSFVQELLLHGAVPLPDSRPRRQLRPEPGAMPRPQGGQVPLARLSASAYDDLRRCPYRFFALRQLGLQEADELDTALDKRDFGNWLHAVLRHFHEVLATEPVSAQAGREPLMDAAAERATRELGLAQAEFLPYAAAWPRVRAHYLEWLAGHEASGAAFMRAEAALEMPLGPVRLAGRIDRIDRRADGVALVIDYKTEARTTTALRISQAAEDTQLAFYAALLEDDTLGAMYLNLGETLPTRAYPQERIVDLRDQLVQGITDDMQRIADGAPLPAMGAGSACDYCAARGLCRKDFWDAVPMAVPGHSDV